MKKETDLEGVKSVALDLLYLPIERVEEMPFLVQHPYFEYNQTMIGNEFIELTTSKENEERAKKQISKKIKSADNPETIIYLIRNSYRLTAFKFMKNYFDIQTFSRILSQIWIQSENPNDDVNVSIRESVSYFKRADKKYLMTDEELDYLSSLPEVVTVYRGVGINRKKNGLSFTDNLEKAKWFAHRFDRADKEGYVLYGQVKKENILAYFTRRNEDEIVVSTKDIIDLKEWND